MENIQSVLKTIPGTRGAILNGLRAAGQSSVSDLAALLDIKPVTIRHHLNVLQADGLIEMEEKRQAIGRPTHIYRLTEQAEALFPHRYHHLVERLLDQVKQTLAPEIVEQLIQSLAASLAGDVQHEFERLPEAERRAKLLALLTREGFMAEWRRTEQGIELVEYHCPYYRVGQRHPEICQIDQEIIRVAMNSEVARRACMLSGDTACTFEIAGVNTLSS